jgi:hypothetical protein
VAPWVMRMLARSRTIEPKTHASPHSSQSGHGSDDHRGTSSARAKFVELDYRKAPSLQLPASLVVEKGRPKLSSTTAPLTEPNGVSRADDRYRCGCLAPETRSDFQPKLDNTSGCGK